MDKQLIEASVQLAESWQKVAQENVSRFDKKFHQKMHKMLAHPEDKVLLVQLMDQCFRSDDPARIANQIVYLLNKHGMASFFSSSDKFLLTFFKHLGVLLPQLSVPLFIKQIRDDSRTVVLKGEKGPFHRHLKNRAKESTDCIVNLIGEIVLGEKEADARLEKYLAALRDPHIEYLSIKLSTLYSQMNSLDMKGTVDVLCDRLSRLFDEALCHPDKNGECKFINLDMEEYRDLEITVNVFEQTLNKPEYKNVRSGIAIQAYLPDSHEWQKRITKWAIARVENGGLPIKIRLVKGANMEMEATEASHRGWEMVTYREKLDTDANYKRMAYYALQPENAKAVHLGTASHNLFEQAWAVTVADALGTSEYHTLEMLEGMSESARLAIRKISKPVMLYAPSAEAELFTNAIAYLVRRLDENTGEDNFIRYSFGLQTGSSDWNLQKQVFMDSFARVDTALTEPFRQQNRLQEDYNESKGICTADGSYRSEADTDFTLPQNRTWAQQIVERWRKPSLQKLPVVANGNFSMDDRKFKSIKDRSFAKDTVEVAHAYQATPEDIALAISTAKSDPDGWRQLNAAERAEKLRNVAKLVRERRGDLIGVAAAELGKAFVETDVEVSEAVDFLEYYALSSEHWQKNPNIEFKGKGVGLVVPPWNFPIAIPLGGVAAALAAGNTVILKPASSAIYCGYELCKCFWDAGISAKTLQFIPCAGAVAGEHLIPSPDIDFVILTGGESTAERMLQARSDLFLTAETGGKDATIVTAMADREQAVRNVVQSAFSNSGQKCSATSLLVLEKEVYEDISFREALADAAKSLKVGSPWDFENKVTLLESKPSGALAQAMSECEPTEGWLVEPKFADKNEVMMKPSIKWGVQPGSFCHMNELFGPLLSVICAENLEEAVEIVNQTGYGLTSGLESLDEREIEYWKNNILAGNLYINRGTTGAIVLRQPFGGIRKSAVGAGRKVGVNNYITQFMDIQDRPSSPIEDSSESSAINFLDPNIELLRSHFSSDQLEILKSAAKSYAIALEQEFSKTHDPFKIRGEHNQFRYLLVDRVCIRAEAGFDPIQLWKRILAAATTGVSFDVRFESETPWLEAFRGLRSHFPKLRSIETTPDEQLTHYLSEYDNVLYCDPQKVSKTIYDSAAKSMTFISRQAPLCEGKLELLNYFHEQAISHSYHRYGNIVAEQVKK